MIRHLAFERYLLRHLAEHGHETAAIRHRLRASGGDRLERLRMLAAHVVGACDDPYLGLTIGQAVTTMAYGVLGHACIHSESLLHAHRFMLKHLWVLQPDTSNAARLDVAGDTITLTYLQPPVWPELPHFYLDLFFSANVKRSRELTDTRLTGARLLRRRPAPAQPGRYQGILGLPVAFGCDVDQLVIPRAIAEAPLAAAAITHSRAYLEQCDALLAGMRRSSSLAEQVRHAMLQQSERRPVSSAGEASMAAGMAAGMAAVAQRLNMSTRTLRRRLSAQGTSFRALRQEVRLHLAGQYLTETSLGVADIAQLLGYFDTPTFTRAFKAWTGRTPRAFRVTGRAGSPASSATTNGEP